MSWSYSKYMAALKREEVLLRRQTQLEASFSTATGTHTHTPLFCLPGVNENSHIPYPVLLPLVGLNAGKVS